MTWNRDKNPADQKSTGRYLLQGELRLFRVLGRLMAARMLFEIVQSHLLLATQESETVSAKGGRLRATVPSLFPASDPVQEPGQSFVNRRAAAPVAAAAEFATAEVEE